MISEMPGSERCSGRPLALFQPRPTSNWICKRCTGSGLTSCCWRDSHPLEWQLPSLHGHSRPGRARSKFGHVRHALKAEVSLRTLRKAKEKAGSASKDPVYPTLIPGCVLPTSGANGSAARMQKTSGKSIRRLWGKVRRSQSKDLLNFLMTTKFSRLGDGLVVVIIFPGTAVSNIPRLAGCGGLLPIASCVGLG